jgi:preprotein translocase subunit SecG
MGFLIALLTVFMVLDCIVLVFLVLIQLPKKDAGAGLAFGAGATDALFGAGSGTVLTKITRHAATIFFVMALVLSLLQSRYHRRSTSDFSKLISTAAPATSIPTGPAAAPGPAGAPVTASTNTFQLTTPGAEATNLPAAATNRPAVATNSPPAPAPQK